MKNIKTIFLVILFLCLSMSMPSISFSAEEAPDIVTRIVSNDGKVIKCDMGWIEGDTFMYRKFGGTMGLPVKRVNLDKTFKKSKEAKTNKQDNGGGEREFGDIVVFNWHVDGRVIPWAGRGSEAYKVVQSATIKNNGPHRRISVHFRGLDTDGYVVSEVFLHSKDFLFTGETKRIKDTGIISQTVGDISKQRKITQWELVGVRIERVLKKAKKK